MAKKKLKKLLIIAGHGEGDPGACSIWGHESDYTRELATLIQGSLEGKLEVIMYDQSKNCYAQSKKGNVPDYAAYDATLEVHFNAKSKKDPYGDGKYTGIGGYVHPSTTIGRKIAESIMEEVTGIGFKKWGIYDSTGLLNLNNAQRAGAEYFLIETAFIDDGDDMKWYTENKTKAAQAIAQGILKGIGLPGKAAEPEGESCYRVRKSWEDEKSQVFAGTKEGAVRCCPSGYSVYSPDGKCIYTKEATGTLASSLWGVSEAAFIEAVGKLYTEDQKRSGILACVSLAQAILESGYGQTDLAQTANNLHGMKCRLSGNVWKGTAWDGDSKYTKQTKEQKEDGTEYSVMADFRCYSCIEDSIADHSAYLLNAPNGNKQRYPHISGEKDYRKAAQIIKDGGYATDTNYVRKLVDIIERWNLTRFNDDSGAKVPSGTGSNVKKNGVPYRIKTTCDSLYIRKGPGKSYQAVGYINEKKGKKKEYTIVEERNGWGRLLSRAGWISLAYTKKV